MSPAGRLRKPSEARWLSDLSPAQQRALPRYANGTVTSCGGPEGAGVAASTHEALLRHGLVEHGRNAKGEAVWRPTVLGRRVLAAEEPRLLAARSDALYATELAEAWCWGDGDPGEGVDEQTLAGFARQAGAVDQLRRGRVDEQVAAERARLGRHLLELRAMAREAGVDARADLRVVERRVDALIAGRWPGALGDAGARAA